MKVFPPLKRMAVYLAVVLALLGAYLAYSLLRVRLAPSVRVPPLENVRSSPLYGHVAELSVRIGSRCVHETGRLDEAKAYIVRTLEAMGHRPELQDVPYEGRTYSNIVVTLPGRSLPGEVVVVGAHYDTVCGTPGADDNASAVAVLLELCRAFAGSDLERGVRFVFFTLEEPPVFGTPHMGSAVFAREAKRKGEAITAMVCLEMVGYYSDRKGGQGFPVPLMALFYSTTPDFIAVVGDWAVRDLVARVGSTLREGGTLAVETVPFGGLVPGADLSDHRSFREAGYRAVMVTDTAFYRNPNYHTENDRIETLDFPRMAALTSALATTVKDLATRR